MEEEKKSSALEHMTEPIVNKSLRKTNDMAHKQLHQGGSGRAHTKNVSNSSEFTITNTDTDNGRLLGRSSTHKVSESD